MGLNDTPKGNRIHIALFGKRNAGKSSLINAITNQQLAIVSEVKGTTTDPVYKAMELLPLGPVMMIDTPGLDDEGALGEQRIEKTMEVLQKTDIALLVVDTETYLKERQEYLYRKSDSLLQEEKKILELVKERNIPYLVVWNKIDLLENPEEGTSISMKNLEEDIQSELGIKKDVVCAVSTITNDGIHMLKEAIAKQLPAEEEKFQIVADLLHPSDFVVLVVPIDKAAPKGRLILPQQQTIRDILEADAIAIVTKEYELRETLEHLGRKPRMVITDSQVFAKVSADTPKDVLLTSFSILMARYKGDLTELVKGAFAVEKLKDGDKILMSEGCTHHRQCDDIGTVKIPRWLVGHTGKNLLFESSSGNGYPKDLSEYAMIVHCGGCMLNRKEMKYRMAKAKEQGIPIVNYGILIAYMQGILERSIQAFPEVLVEIEEMEEITEEC